MIIKSPDMSIRRKIDYTDETIADVSKLVKASESLYNMEKDKPYGERTIKTPILAIPGENKIYCYYGGMTLVVIDDNEWKLFGGNDEYYKYIDAVIEENSPEPYEENYPGDGQEDIINAEVLKNFKKGLDFKEYLFDGSDEVNPVKLKLFMLAAYRGKSDECERHTQQVIAINNCTLEPDNYSVCGFEVQFAGDKDKGGIDLVIFSQKKKKMYLVEYKCKKSSLNGASGIIEHGKNYSKILEFCRNDIQFRSKLLNSYNLMRRIKSGGKKIGLCRIEPAEIEVEILFLFTGTHVRNDENNRYNTDKNLTPELINPYVKKLFCDNDKTLTKMRKYINFYWENDYSDVDFNKKFI